MPIWITLLYGVVLQLILFLVHFSNEQNTSQGPQMCSITDSHYYNLLQQYVIPALPKRQCLESTVFMQDGS